MEQTRVSYHVDPAHWCESCGKRPKATGEQFCSQCSRSARACGTQPEPREQRAPRCIAYLSTSGHTIVLESTDDQLTFTAADVDAAVEGLQAGRRARRQAA